MAETRRLTKRIVDALKPGELAWDSEVGGFGVRCQRRDKVFCVKTRIDGRQRWVTIGRHGSPWTVESGRREALAILGDVARGGDLKTNNRGKAAMTVADLIEQFLCEHVDPKRKASTAVLYRGLLNRLVAPQIGHVAPGQVTKADISKIHRDLADRPYLANRAIDIFGSMYAWAERQDLLPEGTNPCRHIEKYREQSRDRVLSREELQRLSDVFAEVEAEPHHNPYVIAALRLLMLTGARLSEILTLKWSCVDFQRGLLLLPDSKTGKKTIALNSAATEVLKTLPRMEANPFVIVGGREGTHLVNLQKPWRAIRQKAGLDDVRIHDLRHTFATIAAASGASHLVIGKLLGHSQSAHRLSKITRCRTLSDQRHAHASAGDATAVNSMMPAGRANERWTDGL